MLNVAFFVSFLVGLVLMGRLSPSDSPLLLVTLVLVDIFAFIMKCTKFFLSYLFHGTKTLKIVKIMQKTQMSRLSEYL